MYGFEINRELTVSHAKQLEMQLREAILNGRLQAGTRILPTRRMAEELGIARNTVITVYEQLIAEGYLESKEGSGTFVAKIGRLPESVKAYPLKSELQQFQLSGNPSLPGNQLLSPSSQKQKSARQSQLPGSQLQPSGSQLQSSSSQLQPPGSQLHKDIIYFNAGNPDISVFPRIQWAKMLKDACMEADNRSFEYGNYTGRPELRKAICSYIYRVKGIVCEEDQIIITSGTTGGMDILSKAMGRKYNKIAVEDPCIDFVKNIFSIAGYEISPVSVDTQGMDVSELRRLEGADLIYVVPSHQYPIGGVLPAARRIDLLSYAAEKNAYVIEDDYDSEFRYKGEALQALHNLDPDRVIYLGSFSKIFTPSLRLGYMILPKQLCAVVLKQIKRSNLLVNSTLQLAMAAFINQRLLDKHIYKMKKLYEKKRIFLIKCLKSAFGDRIKVSGENAGLHLLVSLDRELTDSDLKNMKENGIDVDFVEDYALIKGKHRNQLVLGYGELNTSQIEEGIERLKAAIDRTRTPEE